MQLQLQILQILYYYKLKTLDIIHYRKYSLFLHTMQPCLMYSTYSEITNVWESSSKPLGSLLTSGVINLTSTRQFPTLASIVN